jgi:glycosyltransferase involved in cell wall biosynthesis
LKNSNRIVSSFLWAHSAGIINADIISGHDLNGLFIGYMSNILKPKGRKAYLIYDSHEFEIGRNAKRNKLQIWWITHLERFLIKRCAFSIVVNDTIADEVQRIHKLKRRPIVVRSTPNLWHVDETVTQQIHAEFCMQLNIPQNSFIVMYHGAIMSNRGIETLIQLVKVNPNIYIVILGFGEAEYMDNLKKIAVDTGVEKRITFHPAVPLEELWKYVGAADVNVILGVQKVKSYYYGLPNKLFEIIQSLTPIIASKFPEMERIIEKYSIGLTCDPENLKEINICIERMRTDKSFYAKCKENLKRAKQELCWEKEKHILIREYQNLLDK